MNQRVKERLCAEFLAKCLSHGWPKADLDELERIWWEGDAWQYTREFKKLQALQTGKKELPA